MAAALSNPTVPNLPLPPPHFLQHNLAGTGRLAIFTRPIIAPGVLIAYSNFIPDVA